MRNREDAEKRGHRGEALAAWLLRLKATASWGGGSKPGPAK
jgi:hypothetical protein